MSCLGEVWCRTCDDAFECNIVMVTNDVGWMN